jgi:hypothetical protein
LCSRKGRKNFSTGPEIGLKRAFKKWLLLFVSIYYACISFFTTEKQKIIMGTVWCKIPFSQ